MRVVLVSSRYGRSTGTPAWSLELRFHGPLRPGYERQHRYLAVWGLRLLAILKTSPVAPRQPSRRGPQVKNRETRGQEALWTPLRPSHLARVLVNRLLRRTVLARKSSPRSNSIAEKSRAVMARVFPQAASN